MCSSLSVEYPYSYCDCRKWNGGSAFYSPRWKAGTLYCQTGTLDRSCAVTPIPVTPGEDDYFSSTLHHTRCQPWICMVLCPLRTLVAALSKNVEQGHPFNEAAVMSRADNYVKLGVINGVPAQAPPVHTVTFQQPNAMPYIGYPLQRALQIGYSCSPAMTAEIALKTLCNLIYRPAKIYRKFHTYPGSMKAILSEEVRKQAGFHLRL